MVLLDKASNNYLVVHHWAISPCTLISQGDNDSGLAKTVSSVKTVVSSNSETSSHDRVSWMFKITRQPYRKEYYEPLRRSSRGTDNDRYQRHRKPMKFRLMRKTRKGRSRTRTCYESALLQNRCTGWRNWKTLHCVDNNPVIRELGVSYLSLQPRPQHRHVARPVWVQSPFHHKQYRASGASYSKWLLAR